MTSPFSGDYTAATTTINHRPQPWSDFLSLSSLSLPVSLSDATTRLTRNSTHFRLNYLTLAYVITLLSLILHPLSLLLVAAVLAAWHFLYFSRPGGGAAVELAGVSIDDRVVAAALGVVTVVVLAVANVWVNVLVSIGVAVVVVCLHGVLRVPSFEGDDPYGGLLDHAASGDYSEF